MFEINRQVLFTYVLKRPNGGLIIEEKVSIRYYYGSLGKNCWKVGLSLKIISKLIKNHTFTLGTSLSLGYMLGFTSPNVTDDNIFLKNQLDLHSYGDIISKAIEGNAVKAITG
jgi:hypothetical protein